MLRPVIAALSMLSRIPLGGFMPGEDDIRRSVAHFPLVGYLAFALYLGASKFGELLGAEPFITALAALGLVYYLFNLFHFDGFLDTIDGMMSQRERGKILEIMKRGNIGPAALFFGVAYLAAKIYLFRKIELMDAAAVFVTARLGMGLACAAGSPAREDGIGRLVLRAPLWRFALSLIYCAALPLVASAPIPRLIAGIAIVLAADYLMVLLISHKIGGLTGDTLGFISEANELLMLLVLAHAIA